jgi:hypothetical protein
MKQSAIRVKKYAGLMSAVEHFKSRNHSCLRRPDKGGLDCHALHSQEVARLVVAISQQGWTAGAAGNLCADQGQPLAQMGPGAHLHLIPGICGFGASGTLCG